MAKPFYEVGAYVGEVTQQALTEAKTGTPQFLLRVKILGYTEGGKLVEIKQQYERSVYMPLTEATAKWVAPKLESLGFNHSAGGLATLDPEHPQAQVFTGNQVDLWCGWQDDGKGGTRENWSLSDGGGNTIASVPLPAKKMRQLDTLFGAAFKAAPKAPPVRNTPPAAEDYADQGITDEDIPF